MVLKESDVTPQSTPGHKDTPRYKKILGFLPPPATPTLGSKDKGNSDHLGVFGDHLGGALGNELEGDPYEGHTATDERRLTGSMVIHEVDDNSEDDEEEDPTEGSGPGEGGEGGRDSSKDTKELVVEGDCHDQCDQEKMTNPTGEVERRERGKENDNPRGSPGRKILRIFKNSGSISRGRLREVCQFGQESQIIRL